ncbi:MAG: VWA domain-containing protein [Trueperaceae bacterium]|nr:VWA domain-containing protein [Trueperaceae bacterium]
MLGSFSLEWPWILLGLLLLPFLRRKAYWSLRYAGLGIMLIALSQPSFTQPSKTAALLIDVSDSLSGNALELSRELDLDLERTPDVYVFASDVTQTELKEDVPGFLDTGQTDLAKALQVLQASDNQRALLISDGGESLGEALKALPNIPVDTLYVASLNNTRLLNLVVPDSVSPGETVEATAVIESDMPTEITLSPSVNGADLSPIIQEVPAGRTAIPFRFQAADVATLDVSARISTSVSQPVQDDSQTAFVSVNNRTPVLVIDDPAMANLLRTQGFDVVETGPEAVVAPLEYSAVILRDSAAKFTTGQLELLESYVLNGGGLMMTGGPDSFGFGAWYRTPVESVLPVNTDLRTEVDLPLVGLVIVLDRSQSMSTGNPSKIDLAKEGAISVVDLAYKDDLLGMIVFSDAGSTEWAFQLRRATDQGKREMLSSILAIETEGGTVLQPAYEQAITALEQTEASIKHIIILSDGKLYDGGNVFGATGQVVDFEAVAQAALDLGITSSTIAIGDGADFERLSAIASAGGGRYYEALNVSTLPQIFTNEALTATRSLLREEAFAPNLRTHPLIPNNIGAAPSLNAYIATSLKENAETLLDGLQGEPILAVHRQGLGRTAALTTDLNGWAGDLGNWAATPSLMGTVVRWLQARPVAYAAQVNREGQSWHVIVDAVKDGQYLNNETLELRYGGANAAFEQVAPGRYEAYIPVSADSNTLIVVDGEEVVARKQVYSQNAEFDTTGGEETLQQIAQRTGGQVVDSSQTYRPIAPANQTQLWPYLALLAFLLFLVELFLRRFGEFLPRQKSQRQAGA